MSTSTPAKPRYADLVPYETPASLDDLRGPTSGAVRVSAHINTAPEPVYDLDSPSGLLIAYSAIVRDGYPQEHVALLDRATLLRLWPDLRLPKRCSDTWTAQFPELLALGLRAPAV